MKKLTKLFLMVAFGFLLVATGCKKDEVTIVGVWNHGTTTVESFTINNKPFVTYMVDLGLTQAQAQEAYNAFVAEVNVHGTYEFKEDGTYVISLTGETPDSGTYKVDGTMVTFDAGTSDAGTATILTLTESNLDLSMSQSMSEDMDEDGTSDTMVIKLKMTFTR